MSFLATWQKHKYYFIIKNFDTNFDTKLTFLENPLFVSKFVLKFFFIKTWLACFLRNRGEPTHFSDSCRWLAIIPEGLISSMSRRHVSDVAAIFTATTKTMPVMFDWKNFDTNFNTKMTYIYIFFSRKCTFCIEVCIEVLSNQTWLAWFWGTETFFDGGLGWMNFWLYFDVFDYIFNVCIFGFDYIVNIYIFLSCIQSF